MPITKIIKHKEKNKKHFTWNGVEVFIKDSLTDPEISVRSVLSKIQKNIPEHLLDNLDSIYVGDFDFFKDREINAMYENSSIFVTNKQDSEEDMCDDIIHEIAHSVEEIFQEQIYSDRDLEREFLLKRKQLFTILEGEGYGVDLSSFLETSYDRDFDEFLYKEIGYPVLEMVSNNLFYSPYAITSLREYFANGFEAFFYYRDHEFMKDSCPQLYKKMMQLLEVGYDQEY